MTERGSLGSDAFPACPFVAYEEDKDFRSTRPDHRHRCWAEPRPAPRALAHQEAFCLNPGFSSCPTFVDWARRQAAAPRVDPLATHDSVRGDAAPRPRPDVAPGADTGAYRPPPAGDRSRDWAAPPPWLADGDGGIDADTGLEVIEPPAFLVASATSIPPAAPSGPGASLADDVGSPAAYAPEAGQPVTAETASASTAAAVASMDDTGAAQAPRQGRSPRPAGGRGLFGRDSRPKVSTQPRPDPAQSHGREIVGPAWEQPRRFEAYPTIRTRVGLPAIPRVVLYAIVIGALAIVLFVVPPLFIGGNGGSVGSASPTPGVSGSVAPSRAPTPRPSPTPLVYVVKTGDTMNAIAKRYGVTVDEILAANPKIKNPNKINRGDKITIPTPAPSDGVGGEPSDAVSGEDPTGEPTDAP